MNADDARRLALAFAGAVQQDHHGRPSFRVGGRIFATLWTPRQLNVMVTAERIEAAVEDDPGVFSPVHWGKRLAAVRVELPKADPDQVEGLLAEAWSRVTRPTPG